MTTTTTAASSSVASTTPAGVRPVTPGMRLMLFVASGLVFSIGISLFLLSEQTDRYFAWTIASPLTAAFLGGAYWASTLIELMAGRERAWCNGRVAVPAVLLFTVLTLIVTLLHIDRFHFNAPELITRLGTWVWLLVYAAVPLIMGVLLIQQLRAPGGDLPREEPLPGWIRALLLVKTTVFSLLGLGLLLAPVAVAPLWPWALTPLTGRAIGAWMLSLGVASGHSAWENDRRRVRPASASYFLLAVLQLIALLRYPGEFSWGAPSGWVYLGFLAVMLAQSGYLLFAPAKPRRATA